MKIIFLTQNETTLVDDEDYEFLLNFGFWCLDSSSHTNYALTRSTGQTIRMHQLILGRMFPGYTGIVDHKNGDGLDNTRSNLRIATKSQNNMNSSPQRQSTSKYKGVTWDESRQKWMAHIKYDKAFSNLSRFDSEIEAAKVYNHAARRLFGEYARLNPI